MTEMMTIEKATELLEDVIQKPVNAKLFAPGFKAGLYSTAWYISFVNGTNSITMDGEFSSEDLIAIAVYMDNNK